METWSMAKMAAVWQLTYPNYRLRFEVVRETTTVFTTPQLFWYLKVKYVFKIIIYYSPCVEIYKQL